MEEKKPTGKDLNRHLTEENVQMGNKHMRRRSTSLVSREMSIKNIMRFYYMAIATATKKIKKTMQNKVCSSFCSLEVPTSGTSGRFRRRICPVSIFGQNSAWRCH